MTAGMSAAALMVDGASPPSMLRLVLVMFAGMVAGMAASITLYRFGSWRRPILLPTGGRRAEVAQR